MADATPKPKDDLDAVRIVVETLQPFEGPDERERILRWACEKLGICTPVGSVSSGSPTAAPPGAHPAAHAHQDIRTFLQHKQPKTASQLCAVVAYYYQFEAREAERKEAISADDVTDACRKAGIERPKVVAQSLVNAAASGVIDRAGKGKYRVNAVGENLVAVVLPGGEIPARSKGRGKAKAAKRKTPPSRR